MRWRPFWVDCLGLGAGVLCAAFACRPGQLQAQENGKPVPPSLAPSPLSTSSFALPLDELPPSVRDGVCRVLEKPTLKVRGPAEIFRGRPAMYHWLLENPDQAVVMWRRLGARCMSITNQGNGRFGWTDGKGSNVSWETVFSDGRQRIWYAEGVVRPSPLLGAVAVRAVVALHYLESQDATGRPLIRHQADLFLQTDSKAVAMVARLLGSSAPHVAEEGIAQMEMFFSVLVWYLDRHPERLETLLR
ncbi:MAG: hypothetical protein JO112_20365 [Planctomycetes bacterium]|nr:hypothetical protein [Planctomycetota bacterium]